VVTSDHSLNDMITLIPTPGHTIDHYAVTLGKGGKDAVFTGDLIHTPLQALLPALSMRVDYNPAEGAFWDVLYRWSPDAVREGVNLSVGESLSALITKYLDCVVAADQQELESFFGNFVPRSRVKEAINALLAARELSFIRVGNRSLIQITPAKTEPVPRVSGPRPDRGPRKTSTPPRI